jgi:bifunctional UDP-N-acetylglucosamine pyrophosphorylase/glucosamine-1-phosphate N-acetyltransferase
MIKYWFCKESNINMKNNFKNQISKTAIIHPTAIITNCKIYAGVIISPYCVISNTTIGKKVKILSHSVIDDCVIKSNATIGPFAHLRPKTIVESCGKVGAFCETKNSTIGQNSKVPHLSYIGDTEIGKNCNIGAGTITCNYDGKNKHKTKIASNVFVGSNSNLIAPIEIGESSFIAAGSTIINNVPCKAFAISRSEQINKPNKLVNDKLL